ncbi:MAG TPA: imidazole glycerol phosphate synthase subunit HisF [Gemmataceae bacterium]|nr:imidazole glycerol phosphate synthase subunit HisF [Gemmataceae bacterium]
MLTKRIIPCLDVDRGRVVKGVNFLNLRDAGDPVEVARRYEADGADELVFLDISASHEGRDILLDVVRRVSEEVFMPFTVGGGIRSLEDATRLIQAGAEKVSINSAAVRNPGLITAVSQKFGRCATVVNIDPRRVRKPRYPERMAQAMEMLTQPLRDLREKLRRELGEDFAAEEDRSEPLPDEWWEVHINGGRVPTGLEAVAWARRVEELGAGEIVLTSMDADGTKAGYDLEMTRAVAGAVRIPVVASGGAGSPEHVYQALTAGRADAALAASIFHYNEYGIPATKRYLAERGVPVRLTRAL